MKRRVQTKILQRELCHTALLTGNVKLLKTLLLKTSIELCHSNVSCMEVNMNSFLHNFFIHMFSRAIFERLQITLILQTRAIVFIPFEKLTHACFFPNCRYSKPYYYICINSVFDFIKVVYIILFVFRSLTDTIRAFQ